MPTSGRFACGTYRPLSRSSVARSWSPASAGPAKTARTAAALIMNFIDMVFLRCGSVVGYAHEDLPCRLRIPVAPSPTRETGACADHNDFDNIRVTE